MTINTALAVDPDAVRSGRYDLLMAGDDGWLSLADLRAMEHDGYEVIQPSVTLPDPDDPDETLMPALFGGDLVKWRGGYFVVERGN